MSRTAFFLAGILMGGAFGLSLLLGHESQWVPFGPFFGVILCLIFTPVLAIVAAIEDDENR